MKKLYVALLFLVSLAAPCVAQQTTGAAKASGACSPAISGNQNEVRINCRGLNNEQETKIILILNKILANQIDPDAVMAKLDEILRAVNPNAGQVTYDFRGVRRVLSPGKTIADTGEIEVFNRLNSLSQGRDWKKLAEESDAEIKKVPEWLTPYAFKGLACVNLGRREEGIKLLEYVDARTTNNPDFDGVRRVLASLKQPASN